MGVIDFMEDISKITLTLTDLLEMRFVGDVNYNNPIAKSVTKIFECQNTKNFEMQQIERAKLLMLIKNLKTIKSYDENLLLKFRKKIQHIRSEEYHGERLEIQISANLIDKKINFVKTESPDFKIFYNSEIFVECTSTHLSNNISKNKDLKYKIKTALRKKSKKTYCKNNAALFVDMANLIFHDKEEKYLSDIKNINSFLKDKMKRTKFGNVTLFSYLLDLDKKTYEHLYIRIDNQNIEKNLKSFLDEHYPIGPTRSIENYLITPQG